jgi:folate-dependent phosphoribosylglycinamide formyltransferase PurN
MRKHNLSVAWDGDLESGTMVHVVKEALDNESLLIDNADVISVQKS